MTRNVYGTPRLFPLLFLVFFAFISSAAQAQVADLVRSALGTQLNGVREKDVPRLEPNPPNVLIGYTELRTNLAGGRHANVRTMRPVVVKDDGTGRQLVAEELAKEPDTWTQFAGWSPDGKRAIIGVGWQSPENAKWEEENK